MALLTFVAKSAEPIFLYEWPVESICEKKSGGSEKQDKMLSQKKGHDTSDYSTVNIRESAIKLILSGLSS